MEQQTVIFLGPQGSGKGTHATMFDADLKRLDPSRPVVHFEMGKNLRDLAGRDTHTSRLMQEIMARGDLIPFNISSSVFSQYLIENMKGDEHLVTDGFPRSETQMDVVDATMAFYKRPSCTVVHIDISDEEGVKRLIKRARADDTEDIIRKRLAWTRAEWMKIRARLDGNPIYKVVEIQGERSIEDVHADILSKLGLS
ncbi:MAG TPA: nucleoside monophosphate kinase [Candidatus Paceibacterota bacterium]|nr:nucleoside monophosphate kinase [Candidatus Paceibacterota bacterium]